MALKALQRFDVKIAMDDFGTGYTSLASLQLLPIDMLKIDQRFVSAMLADGDSTAIVRAILSLARALGMETTAEGIESRGAGRAAHRTGLHLRPGLPLLRRRCRPTRRSLTGWSAAPDRRGAGRSPATARLSSGKPRARPFPLDRLQRPGDDRARPPAPSRSGRRRRSAGAGGCQASQRLELEVGRAVQQEAVDRFLGADPVGERLRLVERRSRPRTAAGSAARFDRRSRAATPTRRLRIGAAAGPPAAAPDAGAIPAARSAAISARQPVRARRSPAAPGCRMPRAIISRTVGAGSGSASSFSSSSAIRSRDRAIRSLARAAQASSAAASGAPAPKRAWKRKKRRIRR